MNDSSLPVESRSTRTPSGGSPRQQPRELEQHGDRGEVVVGAGHDRARRDVADREQRRAAPSSRRAAARRRSPSSAPSPGERRPGDDELHQRRRGLLAGVPVRERVGDPARRAGVEDRARRSRRRGGRRTRRSRRASGSPASATTLQVVRRGSSRRNRCGPAGDVVGDPGRRGQPGDAAASGRARRLSPAAAPAAHSSATGTANEPVAGSSSIRAAQPVPASASRIHSAAAPLARGRRRPVDRLQVLDDRRAGGSGRAASTADPNGGPASTVRAMRDPDCLFCKIVAGEIPATRVREDERTIAFMDINPATRGHLLVIPREHAADLLEIGDEDLAACAAGGAGARRAGEGAARGRRREPAQLVRPRRLADRLPLPRARDPALRRRSAAAALDARARRSRRDRGRRPSCVSLD